MVFATPAVAGPYDLGTVVVRAAVYVNPETAEVHAVSDTIPYIFGGVKLDIRSIDVSINRKEFTLNPTTCREPFAVRSSIFGGGGNPAKPKRAGSRPRSEPVPGDRMRCPQVQAEVLRPDPRRQEPDASVPSNPKFRAILEARKGDANLRRAAFILPRATILDQSHIKTICTRVQLAANECPKNSIYGNAEATSPLLDKPAQGTGLPDLVRTTNCRTCWST